MSILEASENILLNPKLDKKKLISIIMPAMNEDENLPRAYSEVCDIFAKMPEYDYEVLIIDNDSTDNTATVCATICDRNRDWKYIKFSRNFTSEISIAAGLKYAKGDAVIILFSDLQDPPELIPEFVRKWESGYDVVSGLLNRRAGDLWWKLFGAKTFYWFLNKMSDMNIPRDVTDFRLISRPAVNAINRLDERNRYFRGLAHWVGFKCCTIPYDRRPRLKGKSKASFSYLIDFTFRAITNFSIVPMRVFSGFGIVVLAFTIIYIGITLAQFLLKNTIAGFTTIYLLLLLNLAFLSLGIGTLGEYIGRIYIESKRRPLWIVERSLNIEISNEYLFG